MRVHDECEFNLYMYEIRIWVRDYLKCVHFNHMHFLCVCAAEYFPHTTFGYDRTSDCKIERYSLNAHFGWAGWICARLSRILPAVLFLRWRFVYPNSITFNTQNVHNMNRTHFVCRYCVYLASSISFLPRWPVVPNACSHRAAIECFCYFPIKLNSQPSKIYNFSLAIFFGYYSLLQ